jgi:hypothetical protein
MSGAISSWDELLALVGDKYVLNCEVVFAFKIF